MNALEALARCQRAWEATQPQLFMELYPDAGLDDRHDGGANVRRSREAAVSVVEPVAITANSPGGGLALTYDRPRPQDVAVQRGRGQEVTV